MYFRYKSPRKSDGRDRTAANQEIGKILIDIENTKAKYVGHPRTVFEKKG